MVKLVTLTVVTAATLCLVESAGQCSEQFIMKMVNSVCALDKRSLGQGSPIIWSMIQQNLNNLELQYKEMMTGVDEVEDILLGDTLHKRKPKDRNTETRRRPIYLSIYEDIMKRRKAPKSTYGDGRAIEKRDSNIMLMMKKCCDVSCGPEDFKDACEKK